MNIKLTIAITIAGALAAAAFNKPKVYQELYIAAIKWIAAISLIVMLFSFGRLYGLSELKELTTINELNKTIKELSSNTISTIVYAILVPVVLFIYLDILDWLSSKVVEHYDPIDKM